ncbi:hypothetical protein KVR01_010393 [Diaporthe batatas]|uniref:uncharacterized protein n=1 Tax=Diaporthe batatas TaxID=748121 RepID=UPI001D03724C|nr:uncharacterized protein KVR01_010393 [Diaporthe batatas]KAG8159756.1 hypothetical protein KVR01_010393 [Diaporthe batatas]
MYACGAAHMVGTSMTPMALRRTLGLALARQTRPTITRGQRLRVIWCPQGSINARPPYQHLSTAGNGTLTRPYSQKQPTMSSQDPAAAAQPDIVEEQQQQQQQDVEEGEDPDSQPPVVEKWREAVDAVLAATRAAFPSSPAYDAASPGAFQSYWRGVFERLHGQVTADGRIPEHLTSPPCREFAVNIFARGAGDEGHPCPCCLPWVEPSVRLENGAGVTKGDLVRGLGRFLYGGEGLPRVYIEDVEGGDVVPEEEEREKRTGVLVHGADWMSEGGDGGENGERYVYTGGWIGRPAMIWMYCCHPGEFAEKAAATLLRDRADEEDKSGTTMAKL